MLEKQDLTFSKVESWQEFMLSHRMASEMECGLNQNGIFFSFFQSNSLYITIIKSDWPKCTQIPLNMHLQ